MAYSFSYDYPNKVLDMRENPRIQMNIENDFVNSLKWFLESSFHVPTGRAFAIAECLLSIMSDSALHYHTPVHPLWMLKFYMDKVLPFGGGHNGALDRVELLCLWFHDAIYIPANYDNEERSFEFMKALMKPYLERHDLDRAKTIIHETACYDSEDGQFSCPLLMDLDLCNFCFEPEAYADASRLVKKEFMPIRGEEVYESGRKVLLQKFLNRPRIYRTELFRDNFESKARDNIFSSIGKTVDKISV